MGTNYFLNPLSMAHQNRGLEFESSAVEGAILVLPDAAFQSDLNNLERFYRHIGTHAESWYEYANGQDMGRRLDKSGLCLIIGCDKTNSWGIATFSNALTTSRLQFLPVASSSREPGPSYTWVLLGTADSPRIGPSQRGPLPNQCLFIRCLTFKLSESARPGSGGPSGVQIQMESYQSTTPENKQSDPSSLGSSRIFSSTFSLVVGLISAFYPNSKETSALPEPTQDPLEIMVVSYANLVRFELVLLALLLIRMHIRQHHCRCTSTITSFNFLELK